MFVHKEVWEDTAVSCFKPVYYNEERTEMVRSKIKTLGIVAVLMALSVLALYFAQALLMPKYMSNVKEGSTLAAVL